MRQQSTLQTWLERRGSAIRTVYVVASVIGAALLGLLSFRLTHRNPVFGFATALGYALAALTGLEAHYDAHDAKLEGKPLKAATQTKIWRARIGIYGSLFILVLTSIALLR